MNWTTTQPTQPGVYWCHIKATPENRRSSDWTGAITLVEYLGGLADEQGEQVADWPAGSMWFGPIQPPPPPTPVPSPGQE